MVSLPEDWSAKSTKNMDAFIVPMLGTHVRESGNPWPMLRSTFEMYGRRHAEGPVFRSDVAVGLHADLGIAMERKITASNCAKTRRTCRMIDIETFDKSNASIQTRKQQEVGINTQCYPEAGDEHYPAVFDSSVIHGLACTSWYSTAIVHQNSTCDSSQLVAVCKSRADLIY